MQLHVERGEWDEATDDLEQASALSKENDKPQREKIAAAFRDAANRLQDHPVAGQDPDLREPLLRRALALHTGLANEFPDEPVHLENVGHLHRRLGFLLPNRFNKAREHFGKAAEIFEKLAAENPQRGGYYSDYQTDTLKVLAQTLAAAGQNDEAEGALRRSIALYQQSASKFPDQPVNDPAEASAYFDLARFLIKTGRLQEAVPLIARGVEVDPTGEKQDDKLAVQIQLGNLLRESGEFDRAIARYSELIATKPDMAAVWGGRGHCYLAKGELTKAAEDYTRAIELKPDESWYWHERGWCYLMLGEHKKSVDDHTKAIELGDH